MKNSTSPSVWVAKWGSKNWPSDISSDYGLIIEISEWDELHTLSRDVVHRCTLLIRDWNSSSLEIDAKIAFLDAPEEQPRVIDFRDKDIEPTNWMTLKEFQSRFGQFALSIGDRQAYKKIFRILQPEAARKLLLQVNELVALNELRPRSRILRQVRTSRHDLWAQFFREDEEKFALIDFGRSIEESLKVATSLDQVDWVEADIPLWGGRFVLPLRLNFPEVLGQRQLLNVVIGPNGSGKSNLLLGLAQRVVSRRAQFGSDEPSNFASELNDRHAYPSSINVAVFTYERNIWSSLRRKGVKIFEQGVRSSDWRSLSELIYQLISSGPELMSGLREIRLLREILAAFINVKDLQFPLHSTNSYSHREYLMETDQDPIQISLEELIEADERKLTDVVARLDRGSPPFMQTQDGRDYLLSSGERSLVLFCARLMSASHDGALVLIDEPENHLHPRFITLMMQTLARTMQATGSRALVVTHSPFVVREFERSSVKVMKTSAEGVPEIFRPSLQTLGADVAMISDYVFEDETIRKGFQDSIDRALRAQHLQGTHHRGSVHGLAVGLGDDAVTYLIEQSGVAIGKASDA
ncbi:AAA family ATPase [Comamonas testosteroni]|uniref:AAA family ATPase n=1 Tax=Comamonas testosteroni TaxID=285 RepID=UPI00391AB684